MKLILALLILAPTAHAFDFRAESKQTAAYLVSEYGFQTARAARVADLLTRACLAYERAEDADDAKALDRAYDFGSDVLVREHVGSETQLNEFCD